MLSVYTHWYSTFTGISYMCVQRHVKCKNQLLYSMEHNQPWVYLQTTVLNVPGNALNSGLKDLTLGLETNLKVY